MTKNVCFESLTLAEDTVQIMQDEIDILCGALGASSFDVGEVGSNKLGEVEPCRVTTVFDEMNARILKLNNRLYRAIEQARWLRKAIEPEPGNLPPLEVPSHLRTREASVDRSRG